MSWYVSLTLRWTDLEDPGKSAFLDWCERQPLRWNHVRVSHECLHSTIYAIAKIHAPGTHGTMRQAARAVLDALRSNGFHQRLQTLPAFTMEATELRYYINGATVQFQERENKLPHIRAEITRLLSAVTLSCEPLYFDFPLRDSNKNAGPFLYGSLARCPAPLSDDPLQQCLAFQSTMAAGSFAPVFTASQLILTISDDALTNVLEPGDFENVILN